MSYLLDRQKRNKKIRNIFIVIFIFAILFYFRAPIFKNLSYFSQGVLRPVFIFSTNTKTRVNNFASYFSNKNKLFLEIENLKNENLNLKANLENTKSLEDENISLKELLGRSSTEYNYILATIIAKPLVSVFDTIILDIGEDKSLVVGDLVFGEGNIPIGKISEVYAKSSKVTLFSNSGEKTSAIVSSKNISVDLIGRGGGNFEIILPRELVLEEGEVLLLPDLNNLVIAKVVSIISDERESYQKALLISPINIQELKFVQVRK